MQDPVLPQATRATRVSPRGQVTIPKPIREYLGITDGGPIEFVVTDEGAVVVRPRFDSARPLRGLLSAYAGRRPASLESIDEGIGQAIATQLSNQSTDEG